MKVLFMALKVIGSINFVNAADLICTNEDFMNGVGATVEVDYQNLNEVKFIVHNGKKSIFDSYGYFKIGEKTYNQNSEPVKYLKWTSGTSVGSHYGNVIPMNIALYDNFQGSAIGIGIFSYVQGDTLEKYYSFQCN